MLFYQKILKILVSLERINLIFNEPIVKKYPLKKRLLDGSIEIKSLNFSYNEKQVLKEINLYIKENSKVAFVGKSGAGKSTLFKVMTGFYNTYEGSVILGGLEVNDENIASIRKSLGVVFQETFLFDDTIKNNIYFSNSTADEKEFNKIIDMVSINSILDRLDQGLDSNLGENGDMLSGGEKKRIQIARTLLKDSKIFLFDELTASLDNITAETIIKNIIKNYNNKTCIFIEHRLDVVKDVDIIFVMDEGKIVEYGCHDDLIKKGAYYYSLYNS